MYASRVLEGSTTELSDASRGATLKDSHGNGLSREPQDEDEQHQIHIRDFVLHTKAVQRKLMQSAAEDCWIECYREIQNFPLRFRDPLKEAEYKKMIAESLAEKLFLVGLILLLSNISLATVIQISLVKEWLSSVPDSLGPTFWIVAAFGLATSVSFMATSKLPALRPHLEFLTYVLFVANTIPYCTWCLQQVLAGSTMVDWEELIVNNLLEFMHVAKAFAEFRMLLDVIMASVFIISIFIVDIFLKTRSRYTIWFHILLVITIATGRFLQVPEGPYSLKITCYLDALITLIICSLLWCARWFREFQERCIFIKVITSEERLASIKDRMNNRRNDVSVAEEVLTYLEGSKAVLLHCKSNDANSIKALIDQVNDVINTISNGMNTTKKREIQSENLTDEIAHEDAFIEMYESDYNNIYVQVAKQVKRKHSTRKESVKWNLENEISVGGIKIMGTRYTIQFCNIIGRDMTYRVRSMGENSAPLLAEVGVILLQPYIDCLGCTYIELLAYLTAMDKLIAKTNPFHNAEYSAQVAHFAMCTVNCMALSEHLHAMKIVALILAALGNSIGHTGRSSVFYVASNSLPAILRNDKSVYEGLSAHVILSLADCSPDTNIFGGLTKEDYSLLKSTLNSITINSDMSKHFDFLSGSRVRRINPEFNYLTENIDSDTCLTLVLKVSLYSYATFEWPLHLSWIQRLQDEYYQQGASEISLGLPPNPLSNRSDHTSFTQKQLSLLELVLIPLFTELSEYDKTNDVLHTNVSKVTQNKDLWKTHRDSGKNVDIQPNEYLKIADSRFLTYVLYQSFAARTFADLMCDPSAKAMNGLS